MKNHSKLVFYANGINYNCRSYSFISGNLLSKNYNFILFFKGENNKNEYDSIYDNLISHIYSQLNVMNFIDKLAIKNNLGTNNRELINNSIKELFNNKWNIMINNNSFYKKYKLLRITYNDILNEIGKKI